ncbi:serpin peptidase inhibitor, clade A (alpha-1 antiproteinase, antitrypsin), member [Loxospora ochrophaea]|nr:serpin peptidase inhibitor, clade A (alpha-1 antiproteinase, antitrypsin), member [Loxospora ochrophaea]
MGIEFYVRQERARREWQANQGRSRGTMAHGRFFPPSDGPLPFIPRGIIKDWPDGATTVAYYGNAYGYRDGVLVRLSTGELFWRAKSVQAEINIPVKYKDEQAGTLEFPEGGHVYDGFDPREKTRGGYYCPRPETSPEEWMESVRRPAWITGGGMFGGRSHPRFCTCEHDEGDGQGRLRRRGGWYPNYWTRGNDLSGELCTCGHDESGRVPGPTSHHGSHHASHHGSHHGSRHGSLHGSHHGSLHGSHRGSHHGGSVLGGGEEF